MVCDSSMHGPSGEKGQSHLVGEVADQAAGVGQGASLHDARAGRQQGDQRALAGGSLRRQAAKHQHSGHGGAAWLLCMALRMRYPCGMFMVLWGYDSSDVSCNSPAVHNKG